MMKPGWQCLAPPGLFRAEFIDRPNRFLVRARTSPQGLIEAHLPNSGRLWALLVPGTLLYLAPFEDEPQAYPGKPPGRGPPRPPRKTNHVVWAAERDGQTVFLHTAKTNQVARILLEQRRIPGLENSRIVKTEAVHGHSRFDFLLEEDGRRFFLEVKSVTSFANGTAMFPDGVTARGRRHLLELAEPASSHQGAGGLLPVVLFMVHGGPVSRFLPDYHTDPGFARTFCEVRDRIRMLPICLQWDRDLNLGPVIRPLEIPWTLLQQECQDRGAYLLLVQLESGRPTTVGQLGNHFFEAGWYIYVGSAMQHLESRIARHLRKRKKPHWHIDSLNAVATSVIAMAIRSSSREECAIARALSGTFAPGPPGFGSSDCDCPQHLFFSKTAPLQRTDFHQILHRFRIPAP